jgi:hypothetical protein
MQALPQANRPSNKLFAYYRLNTLGWYYVVEADYQKLLTTGKSTDAPS